MGFKINYLMMKPDCFRHTFMIKTEENESIYLFFLNVSFLSNFQFPTSSYVITKLDRKYSNKCNIIVGIKPSLQKPRFFYNLPKTHKKPGLRLWVNNPSL